MLELCPQCLALISGSTERSAHSSLLEVSTGTGTTGGRKVNTALLRCSNCSATWQRETDQRTLQQLWFLKAP
jgi:hypothetical protein